MRDEDRQSSVIAVGISPTGDFGSLGRNHEFHHLYPRMTCLTITKETTATTSSPWLQSQKNNRTVTASVMAQMLVNKAQIKAQIQEGLLGGT